MKWIAEAIPRTNFGKDLLFTMGAFLTICRVQRNNAEARINAMKKNGWQAETIAAVTGETVTVDDEEAEDTDLEALAQDQISQLIAARFKGHGLTRLVEAILRSQGYTTYCRALVCLIPLIRPGRCFQALQRADFAFQLAC